LTAYTGFFCSSVCLLLQMYISYTPRDGAVSARRALYPFDFRPLKRVNFFDFHRTRRPARHDETARDILNAAARTNNPRASSAREEDKSTDPAHNDNSLLHCLSCVAFLKKYFRKTTRRSVPDRKKRKKICVCKYSSVGTLKG